ncbi:MAG: hypothetical protein V1826_02500 [bacterium]
MRVWPIIIAVLLSLGGGVLAWGNSTDLQLEPIHNYLDLKVEQFQLRATRSPGSQVVLKAENAEERLLELEQVLRDPTRFSGADNPTVYSSALASTWQVVETSQVELDLATSQLLDSGQALAPTIKLRLAAKLDEVAARRAQVLDRLIASQPTDAAGETARQRLVSWREQLQPAVLRFEQRLIELGHP